MSFPAYPTYRSVGCDFPQLPSHWGMSPLKAVAHIEMGQSPSSDDCNREGIGVPFLQGCAEFGTSHPEAVQFCEVARKLAEPGDMLLSVRAPVGALNLADQLYGIGRGLCAIRVRGSEQRFLRWALAEAVERLNAVATGSTYAAVSVEQVASLQVPTPPVAEQAAIAAFLDRETGKIDVLVEAQKRLIGLLREKRQAVISHAVTKGLDAAAPMKDSGVEWLGEVPAHWEVKRLRFLADISTGDGDTADAQEDGEFPFYVRSPIIERIGRFTHDCEAVLTSGDGAGVGKIFHHVVGKFTAHQRVYIFDRFRAVTAKFFFHYLRENFFKVALEGGAKSTVDSLRRPLIANFWMTVPPKNEQEAIILEVEGLSQKFDNLIREAEVAISLFQERRAALISAAVTGKIDVRALVADQTERDAA